MNKQFQYSVLQYVHSQILGERLNLGILFYFPSYGKVIFHGFDRFRKYKSLYKSYPETAVEEYLSSFSEASLKLGSETISQIPFSRFLSDRFINEESAPFQFCEIKTGVLYSDNINKIVHDYSQLYLSELGTKNIEISNKIISHTPVQRFKSFLEERLPNYKDEVKKDIILRVDNIIFKSDLVWDNGTTNIVKGVAFTKSEEHIIDTALLLNKKLDSLEEESKKNNYRFDILVQKPQNEKLHKHFDNALEILNEIKAPKYIIREEIIERYANFAVDQIQNHDNPGYHSFPLLLS